MEKIFLNKKNLIFAMLAIFTFVFLPTKVFAYEGENVIETDYKTELLEKINDFDLSLTDTEGYRYDYNLDIFRDQNYNFYLNGKIESQNFYYFGKGFTFDPLTETKLFLTDFFESENVEITLKENDEYYFYLDGFYGNIHFPNEDTITFYFSGFNFEGFTPTINLFKNGFNDPDNTEYTYTLRDKNEEVLLVLNYENANSLALNLKNDIEDYINSIPNLWTHELYSGINFDDINIYSEYFLMNNEFTGRLYYTQIDPLIYDEFINKINSLGDLKELIFSDPEMLGISVIDFVNETIILQNETIVNFSDFDQEMLSLIISMKEISNSFSEISSIEKIDENIYLVDEMELIFNENGFTYQGADFVYNYVIIEYYTIKLINIDGSVIEELTIKKGETPTFDLSKITHPENSEKYGFVGLDKNIDVATEDVIYTAVFEINKFVVEFYDDEGNLIEEQEIDYGTDAISPSGNLDKKDRWFKGWDSILNNITENKTITAIYEAKEIFTINFKNSDGSMLESLTLYDGDKINAPTNIVHPENPEKYSFVGWDKNVDEYASEDVDYITEFEINTFTVIFYDNHNSIIEIQTVLYGENATHPEKDLDKIDRYFVEWDSSLENITANIIINAVYEMKELYTYTFLDYDKTIFATLKFYEGQELIVPAPSYKSEQNSFDFIFSHWTPELQEFATEDAIYEAVYDVIEKYKIVFKDINGEIVSKQLVLKGELPEAPILPHPTENHKFIQDNWNEKVVPAESDRIYEVRYKLRTFNVDFFFSHVEQRISRQIVEYGSDAVAPSTKQERYTFIEWDADFTNVTEDIRVNGIFEEHDHVLINFFETNGNLIHSIKNYGDTEMIDLQRDYSTIFDQPLHKYGYDISKIYELIITEDSEEDVYYNFGKSLKINEYREYNFIVEYEERELHKVTIVLFDGTEVVQYVYDGYFPEIEIPTVPDYRFYDFIHNNKFLQVSNIEDITGPGYISLRIYKEETIRLFYTDNSPFYKEIELGKFYEIHDVPNYRTWLFKDLEIEPGNYHFIFKSNEKLFFMNETRIVNIVISEENINMMIASIAPTRQKILLGTGYFVVDSQTTSGGKVTVENINSDYEFITFFSTYEGQFSLNEGHVDFSPENPDETPDDENPIPPRDEWKLTIPNILILLFGITGLVLVYKAIKSVIPGKKKRRRRR